MGASILTLWLLVQELGLAERGRLLFLQVVFNLIATFLRFGVQHNIQYFRKNEQKDVIKKSLTLLIMSSILSFFLVVALFRIDKVLIYTTLEKADSQIFGAFCASSLLYGASSYYVMLLRSASQRAAQQIAHSLILVISVLFLILNHSLTLNSFFMTVSAVNFVIFLINLIQIGLTPSFPKSIQEIFSIYGRGIKVMGWSFLKDLMYKIDVLLLPAILTELEFGIYAIIQTLSQMFWRVADPLLSLYNRFLISDETWDGLKINTNLSFKMMFAILASLIYLACISLAFILLTNQVSTTMILHVVLWGFASLGLSYWKYVCVGFLAEGKNRFMYVTISLYIALYLIFINFVFNLSTAISLVSCLYLLLVLVAFICRKNPVQYVT